MALDSAECIPLAQSRPANVVAAVGCTFPQATRSQYLLSAVVSNGNNSVLDIFVTSGSYCRSHFPSAPVVTITRLQSISGSTIEVRDAICPAGTDACCVIVNCTSPVRCAGVAIASFAIYKPAAVVSAESSGALLLIAVPAIILVACLVGGGIIAWLAGRALEKRTGAPVAQSHGAGNEFARVVV